MPRTDDVIAIAHAIRDLVVAGIPEVADNSSIGRNVVRQTPALQVIPKDGDIQSLSAGGGLYLNAAKFEVVFFRIYNPNRIDDEEKLGELLNKAIKLFKAPDTDTTLGGLVETCRPTGYEFGELPQNRAGTAFKVAVLYVSAGEPLGARGF